MQYLADNTPILPKPPSENCGELHKTKEYTVAIYCRLSSEDADKQNKSDDSESIQNQKSLLSGYALERGWSIYQIYSDDDYSGLDRERPAFRRMLEDAKAGRFGIILCKTQSRFTRDMEVVEKYIHGLFVLWGIRFVSVVDNVDSSVKANKKARQIYGLINEWYCEDLSENIRSVFNKKMRDGEFLGPFACYGYLKDPEDRHRLIVDEEAAEVVRKIFGLYIQGYGCRQIARQLTEGKTLTPTAYKQSKGLPYKSPNSNGDSVVWASNTISRILQNSVYIGVLSQGRERRISYKSKRTVSVPKEEWIVVPNNHEPIIDEKIFDLVQLMIKEQKRAPSGSSGKTPAHPLAGKVSCLACGANMPQAAATKDGDRYLKCGRAIKTNRENKKCTPHTIRLEVLSEIVYQRLLGVMEEYVQDEGELEILAAFEEEKTAEEVKARIFSDSFRSEMLRWFVERVWVGEENDSEDQRVVICWRV